MVVYYESFQILPGESPYNPNMRFTTRQRNLPEWVNPQLTKFVTRLLKVVRPKLQDDDLQKLAFDVTSLTENLHKVQFCETGQLNATVRNLQAFFGGAG